MNKKVVHYLFENQVRKGPERIAISMDTEELTYRDLNAGANRVVHLLNDLAAGRKDAMDKDNIVAVFLEDNLVQLITLLGIFKSGSIYCPLDRKYNRGHWEELFQTIRPKTLLISRDRLSMFLQFSALFEYSIPVIIIVDRSGSMLSFFQYRSHPHEELAYGDDLSEGDPQVQVEGEAACYIFFTSGSTGSPKPVLGCHQSLSHFIHWETNELGITDKVRTALLTSLSFDASMRDIFVPLLNGGTICIPAKGTKEDISGLIQWIKTEKITLLHTIPTMLRLLSPTEKPSGEPGDTFPDLGHLLLAGEKLYNRDIAGWRERYGDNTAIYNLYGATESTLIKSFYRVKDELTGKPSDLLPVGQPISNTKLLILNEANGLCGINETGSIYIRTPFLSKGYYKDEESTAAKFVQNPLLEEKEIVYKTGDHGKYDAERNVIVIGREDAMVKLNGVRIDLNSIESAIMGQGAVEAVKCLVYEPDTVDSMLVCFFRSGNVDETRLRQYCGNHLSQYEMPSLICRLDEFPVNANGKVDTAVLQTLAQKIQAGTEGSTEPKTMTESRLADIWQTLLGVAAIGASDSFFELGGNSLKAIRMINEIHKKFGVKVSVDDVFKGGILRELAKTIDDLAIRSLHSPAQYNDQIKKTIEI
jgi:amino acid adenylation domain-containing protein